MKFLEKYFAVLTGLLVFIIYLFTLAPSVIQIDTGELAAVQVLAGIAHPTGYPLFTVLGYLFSLIPLPFTKIFQLNLLTAVWCSAAIGIFVYTCKMTLDNISFFQSASSKKSKQKKNKQVKQTSKKETNVNDSGNTAVTTDFTVSNTVSLLASVLAGFVLAFSKTFWFQSTSVEVYSLHIFVMSLIILFLLKSFIRDEKEQKLKQSWMLFAFMLAMGFSNHMTTLLIIPAAAFLYFNKYGLKKEIIKGIGIMLALFFPLLALTYSYLPLRASASPLLNWGNPVDMERILRHISGKQYQVWLFSSTDAAKKQLEYFITNLPVEFSLTLIFGLAGIVVSLMYARKLFYFLGAAFLFTVIYSINYDIADIDAYFLLAYMSLAFFALIGIAQLLKTIHFKKYSYLAGTAAVLLFIGVEFYSNYEYANQSNTYTFEDYTKAILDNSEKNSLILSYQWDNFISAAYYFQYVEDYRKDVTIIDKELIRRSWYFNQVRAGDNVVFKGLENEISMFVKALQPFERSENFDPNLLENLYRTILSKLVSENFNRKTIYIAPELVENEMQKGEFPLPEGYTIIPDNLMFRVVRNNTYQPAKAPLFTIRFPETRNNYISSIESITANMLIRRAIYEYQNNKAQKAKLYVNKIKREFPQANIPTELLQLAD